MLHGIKSSNARPLHVLNEQAYVSSDISINVTVFTHIKGNHKDTKILFSRVQAMQKSTLLSAGRESERLGDIWVNGHNWTKVKCPQSSRFHFKHHTSVRAEASWCWFRSKMPGLRFRTGSLPNTLSEQSEGFMRLCPSVRTIILSSEQMNYSQALAQY